MWYVSNLLKSFSFIFRASVGQPFPRSFGLVVWHRKHAVITTEQFEEAHHAVCEKMLARGFTLDRYELREFSCGQYAMQKASLLAQHLGEKYEFDLAPPIKIIDYTRDSDRKGHVRLEVRHGGKTYYYEPYAELEYRTERNMSKNELRFGGIIQV